MRLAELGELKTVELIKSLVRQRSKLVTVGIGDDSAVLKDNYVITTDAYLNVF